MKCDAVPHHVKHQPTTHGGNTDTAVLWDPRCGWCYPQMLRAQLNPSPAVSVSTYWLNRAYYSPHGLPCQTPPPPLPLALLPPVLVPAHSARHLHLQPPPLHLACCCLCAQERQDPIPPPASITQSSQPELVSTKRTETIASTGPVCPAISCTSSKLSCTRVRY